MMGENNIFFAGGDALVYLAVPMHKKYTTIFAWGYPFSTYVSQDRFFNPILTCKHMYTFRVTVSAVQLFQKIKHNRTYVLNNMTQMQISTNKTRHHMTKT